MKKEQLKHGFYKLKKRCSRQGNEMATNNCLRNNYRKSHRLPMFRTVK